MDFYDTVRQVLEQLQRDGRTTYRALKRQFNLDDEALEDLKEELLFAHPVVDKDSRGLVWTETAAQASPPPSPTSQSDQLYTEPERDPALYTPQHLAEKILTSRSALEGERKQVTVMFADIKDSTELIRDLDPEDAQRLLDPAIHIMMDAVHRFEGTVNQVLGDGVMALFGAPVAHEDHAARACYAALAMQAAMQDYTEKVRRTQGLELRIRVGLNSGEVVVRTIGNDLHMDYSAVGPTTHLASRMEQLATPGSIRLSSSTLRLVEGLVQVNVLGPVPVKGMSEPMEVYELIGASAIRRRLQTAVVRGLTKFVGRETEIDALNQARDRAEAGHGQVVAAVGEAGVGKSRLVYEFVHSHRTQGWLVLESASVSYGKATPYFPVIDLLKRYVHVEDGDESRTIRAKVTGQILTLDEALQETIPALLLLLDALPEDSPFLQLDPPQRRQRTLDGLKRILLRESQVQPLLLIFEDLHWIDSETQALLDSLIESLPTAQLLLLVNYRPDYQHAWGSKTYYTQLRLDPLPPKSADAFLEALLGDNSTLEPLKPLLIERTHGNPFFLEETVRTLVETEVLVGEPGGYLLVSQLPSIQVPDTVQAILAARIDRLPREEKRLLQTAAVIGTEVPFTLLQSISELFEEVLYRNLTHLQTAEFLYETSLFPVRVYTFKHALTQQVAYESLLTRTRQQVHGQVAQMLEVQFPDMVASQPELLAHHYTEAGLYAQAVGYWQRAGERVNQHSAYIEAIIHLRKGLEVLSHLPESSERDQHELALQIALFEPLNRAASRAAPEVGQTLARARELCEQQGDDTQIFRVLIGLREFHHARGECEAAKASADQLLSLAQQRQGPVFLMTAHYSLGDTLFHLGEMAACRTHAEQGMTCYDALEQRSQAYWFGVPSGMGLANQMSRALWCLGYPDQAMQWAHEGLARAQTSSQPFTLMVTNGNAAWIHQNRGECQEVKVRAEAVMALLNELDVARWPALANIYHGWALMAQGEYDVGLRQIENGFALWQTQANDFVADRPYFVALQAEAYGAAGCIDAGLHVLTEALNLVDKTSLRFWQAELYRLKGELLLNAGCGMRGAELTPQGCFRQAITIARRQQAKSLELRAATSLARLWQSQGKRQAAYDLLAPVYNWFTEGFDTADLKDAKALLQELAG